MNRLKKRKLMVIINQYSWSVPQENSRHHMYADIFSKNGYKTFLITSGSKKESVDKRKILINKMKSELDYRIFLIGIPKFNNRILEWIYFSFAAFIKVFLICLRDKSSIRVIYSSHVQPISLLIGPSIKFILPNIKIISEIRDLWPESIYKILKWNRKRIFYKFLYCYFRSILISSDISITLAKKGNKYYQIPEKNNFIWLPNPILIPPSLKNNEIIIKSEKVKFCYSGAMNKINGISYLVNAINKAASIYCIDNKLNGKDIEFHFIGSGDQLPLVENLKSTLSSLNIDVFIYGNLDKDLAFRIEKECYYSLCPIIPQNVHRYGNSQNKIISAISARNHIIYTGLNVPNSIIYFYKYKTLTKIEPYIFSKDLYNKMANTTNQFCSLDKDLAHAPLSELADFTPEVHVRKILTLIN